MTIFPNHTFWKRVLLSTTLCVYCNLFSIRHFVHISSIHVTQNYGHLRSTRLTRAKWKVVKPGNRCNACEKVTRSGCGWTIISLFFSAPICICNHIPRPNILKLWKHVVCKCGYCNTYKQKSSSVKHQSLVYLCFTIPCIMGSHTIKGTNVQLLHIFHWNTVYFPGNCV